MNKILYVSLFLLLAGIAFSQPKEILITWECNMELEIASTRFNPSTDTVSARGDFNGWGQDYLIADPGDPNYYISEIPFADTLDVGDTVLYKFFYTPDVWETVPNRVYVLSQADYDLGEAFVSNSFNNGSLQTVTLTDSTVVKFSVDVNGAVSSINGQPFTTINSVVIAGGVAPLQWPDGGWPASDIDKTIPLTDQGGGIWSADVVFGKFTVFDISYKYGINYGDSLNNQGGNDNEAGVEDNHMISLSSYLWYAEVDNVFGTMGAHNFTTGVKDITQTLPTAYTLEQNFPNPFNPTTMINFSIPVEGFVTLNVYNSIGQQVANLISESKSAGTYQVGFDATNLTSGIYFYKISAGNFTETKKMILLK